MSTCDAFAELLREAECPLPFTEKDRKELLHLFHFHTARTAISLSFQAFTIYSRLVQLAITTMVSTHEQPAPKMAGLLPSNRNSTIIEVLGIPHLL